MANIRGNEIALESVLGKMLPASPRQQVQQPIDQATNPFWSKTWSGGSGQWELIDVLAYEITILGSDTIAPNLWTAVSPAWVRFGSAGPASASSTSFEGAIPVWAGTRIKLPQGCPRFWFFPTSGFPWRVVITRLPHVSADHNIAPPETSTFSPMPVNPAGVLSTYSNGVAQTAPGAQAVLADSGSLVAGDYEIIASFASTDTANQDVYIVERNPGNTGDVSFPGMFTANAAAGAQQRWLPRRIYAGTQRVLIRNGATAGTAGKIYQAHLAVRLVA
jgi:hypothetical protein